MVLKRNLDFQWMICLNHIVRIICHLMISHYNWIEDASVQNDIAVAKKAVQEALKPGQHPGGSKEDNIGKKSCFVYLDVIRYH